MQLFRKTGELLTLTARLGHGGESVGVFAIDKYPHLAAKIYKSPSADNLSKLHSMCANRPDDPTASQGHISICWPIEVLYDSHKHARGFLMKRANIAQVQIAMICNPISRQATLPEFSWKYILQTAANIASAVKALHMKGYVVGDINDRNILVANTALVTLIDCDSMQVPQPGGMSVFRCPVYTEEFTAPELQGCDVSAVDRTVAQDNFAMGVLFFLLVMEGVHPYAGILNNGLDLPLNERIRLGCSPYNDEAKARAMPVASPFEILPRNLQTLFRRCFSSGTPHRRPSAGEWKKALDSAARALTVCHSYSEHVYSSHLPLCPWCARAAKLGGFDSFQKQTLPTKQQAQTLHSGISPRRNITAALPSATGTAIAPVRQTMISGQSAVSPATLPIVRPIAALLRPPMHRRTFGSVVIFPLAASAVCWLISFFIWHWYFSLDSTRTVTQAGDTARTNAAPVAYVFGIPVIAAAIILLSVFVSRVVTNWRAGGHYARSVGLLVGWICFLVTTAATVAVLTNIGGSRNVPSPGGVTLTPPSASNGPPNSVSRPHKSQSSTTRNLAITGANPARSIVLVHTPCGKFAPPANLNLRTSPQWEITSSQTYGNGTWKTQPVLTVNGVNYPVPTPQHATHYLTEIKSAGGTGDVDGILNQFRVLENEFFDCPHYSLYSMPTPTPIPEPGHFRHVERPR